MPMDAQALQRAAAEPAREDEYEALLAALSASARGRAFLAEYARRHRHAETERVLAALQRLERRIAAALTPPPAAAGERRLAAVPLADEPELPIPSPLAERPQMALADANAAADGGLPAVEWVVEPTADAGTLPSPPGPRERAPGRRLLWGGVGGGGDADASSASTTTPLPNPPPQGGREQAGNCGAEGDRAALPPADPLADLMALSDEERLALFS